MHAYTYSGHPTCCAVALANIEILESEKLVGNASVMGQRLMDGLNSLAAEFECIGNVRGLGLMAAIEFVANRETKEPAGIGEQVRKACITRGLFTRVVGDTLVFAPPLVINAEEIDLIVQSVGQSIAEVIG